MNNALPSGQYGTGIAIIGHKTLYDRMEVWNAYRKACRNLKKATQMMNPCSF